MDIAGYGSHLFTSESMGSVTIGSALLNMTEVIPHPFVPLVFTLVVNITYTLEEALTISCKNHELNETRQVLLQSKSGEEFIDIIRAVCIMLHFV